MQEFEDLDLRLVEEEKPGMVKRVKESFSIFAKSFRKKLEYTKGLITGKYYAYNKEYEGAPTVSQEVVEANPRKWIIEECIEACRILWDKNIYTFMCSDMLDKDAWIELRIDSLSPENKAILERIKEEFVTFQYHVGCINICVKGMGKEAASELVRMANMFVMQDVPKEEATVSIDDILIEAGCYTLVENPNFQEEYAKWFNPSTPWGTPMPLEYFKVVDRSKMDKTEEEYISAYGGIKDEGVIYRSRFHFNKHIRWNLHQHKKENSYSKK